MAECKRAFGGNRDKASSNTWGCAHPRPLQGFANPDPNLRASIGLEPAKALVLLEVSWWRAGRLASGDKDGRCSYPLISDRCPYWHGLSDLDSACRHAAGVLRQNDFQVLASDRRSRAAR